MGRFLLFLFQGLSSTPFPEVEREEKEKKKGSIFFYFRYMIAWLVVCTALSASVLAVKDGATTIYDPLPILHLQTKEESTKKFGVQMKSFSIINYSSYFLLIIREII